MTGRLRTSPAGLDLIKSFEGFRDTAFRLPDGRWTIGYGHVRTAREGLVIKEKDAEELLQRDLVPAEEIIQTSVYAPLGQHQFDALVSLAFNISPGQFRDSEVLRALNAGDFIAAANGFDAWRRARINGRLIVVDALVRRRTMEKAMFLDPPSGRPIAPTPLVTPEHDAALGEPAMRPASEGPAARHPAGAPEAANDEHPPPDVAEAVRRVAEATSQRPAARVSGSPAMAERPAPPSQPAPVTIENARQAVSDRLARILERTESNIADSKAAQAEAASVAARQAPPARSAPVVIDAMPDFDAPPAAMNGAAAPHRRPFIDDTETFDPGRDPAQLYADAVRAEQIAMNRKPGIRLGGSMGRLAPWFAVLVLSSLGLAVALVDMFTARGAEAVSGPLTGASTVFAVFGLMLVMSVYFLATRSRDLDS